MGLFDSAFSVLDALGFFRVVLPFLLVYSIIYGTLIRTKIFGDKAENVNAMVSFSIALIFVAAANVVNLMQAFLPWVGLIAIFTVSALMLFVLVMGGDIGEFKKYKTPAVIMIFIAIFYALFTVAGWWDVLGSTSSGKWLGIISLEDVYGIVILVIILAALAWITGGVKLNGSSGEKKS